MFKSKLSAVTLQGTEESVFQTQKWTKRDILFKQHGSLHSLCSAGSAETEPCRISLHGWSLITQQNSKRIHSINQYAVKYASKASISAAERDGSVPSEKRLHTRVSPVNDWLRRAQPRPQSLGIGRRTLQTLRQRFHLLSHVCSGTTRRGGSRRSSFSPRSSTALGEKRKSVEMENAQKWQQRPLSQT